MLSADQIVGSWVSTPNAPTSSMHRLEWRMEGTRLCGTWTSEAGAAVAAARGRGRRIEFPIEDAWVEGDRVLFRMAHNPLPAEFRVVGASEATMGASLEHLPDHLKKPDTLTSIEAHRVRLVRQTTAAC
jgi:hypothetical protein